MSVLDRSALEHSPLSDLHTIASELSIDGYRRLRRAELVDVILGRQGGEAAAAPADGEATPGGDGEDRGAVRRRRGRRGGRGRAAEPEEADETSERERGGLGEAEGAGRSEPEAGSGARGRGARTERPSRSESAGGKGERAPGRARSSGPEPEDEEKTVEGTVELIANGSGFLRLSPPEASGDDVYISAAQVKRCELVAGDTISGPRRAPRRSERFPSLIRVDTINGRPADEVAEGVRFEDLPAAFPRECFNFAGSDEPILTAIAPLAPLGRGSRVIVVGAARTGKSEALRAFARALGAQEDVEVLLVLAGVRPEEIHELSAGMVPPAGAVSFAASGEAQSHVVERVVDQARRMAARGASAVVLIDTLDGVSPLVARKTLAAARNILDGGSLTVIATAAKPFGGETTVIALDAARAAEGRFPALDPLLTGTLRPELLVGAKAAAAITKVRAEALAS